MAANAFLVTCEHGGNNIPLRYQALFARHEAMLQTHRGYDAGALVLAQELAQTLQAPLVSSTVSRLLVDLNRSPGHPHLFSFIMRGAPLPIREEVIAQYYRPYREQAEQTVATAIRSGRRLIHISSHSFTPKLDGKLRNADIGLLYDPARNGETEWCLRWQAALRDQAPHLRVRRNYPYTGASDGLCTFLRRRYPAEQYLGMELEINQKHVLHGGESWKGLRQAVLAALMHTLPTLENPSSGV